MSECLLAHPCYPCDARSSPKIAKLQKCSRTERSWFVLNQNRRDIGGRWSQKVLLSGEGGHLRAKERTLAQVLVVLAGTPAAAVHHFGLMLSKRIHVPSNATARVLQTWGVNAK